jgi:pimeloyl-ACP methyl ester carboxylesterase
MLSITSVLRRPAYTLVVAFGGLKHGYGGIKGEFRHSVERLDCAGLFVRDEASRWYQYEAAEMTALIEQIQAFRAATGARRLVCLGNSMGGFGALLFASRLKADAAIAFCAQTAITPDILRALGDDRWVSIQGAIPAYPAGDLLLEPAPGGRVVMCWGAEDPLDTAHVERLAGPWSAERVAVTGASHDAAWVLRERGELLPLLADVIGG